MIINLTPHPINILDANGAVLRTFASSGVARAVKRDFPAAPIGEVATVRSEFGPVDGLPDPTAGTFYIVSSIAAQAARSAGRTTDDLLIPGAVERDEDGRPIGVRKLSRL